VSEELQGAHILRAIAIGQADIQALKNLIALLKQVNGNKRPIMYETRFDMDDYPDEVLEVIINTNDLAKLLHSMYTSLGTRKVATGVSYKPAKASADYLDNKRYTQPSLFDTYPSDNI
jgi:hypothetical protein